MLKILDPFHRNYFNFYFFEKKIPQRIKWHLFHLAIQSFQPRLTLSSKGGTYSFHPCLSENYLFNGQMQRLGFSPDEKGFPWQTGWSKHHQLQGKDNVQPPDFRKPVFHCTFLFPPQQHHDVID